jgi:hypothetical protein
MHSSMEASAFGDAFRSAATACDVALERRRDGSCRSDCGTAFSTVGRKPCQYALQHTAPSDRARRASSRFQSKATDRSDERSRQTATSGDRFERQNSREIRYARSTSSAVKSEPRAKLITSMETTRTMQATTCNRSASLATRARRRARTADGVIDAVSDQRDTRRWGWEKA